MPECKVKICGVTASDTIKTCAEVGVDYIGFVFYAPSPRNIVPAMATKLAAEVKQHAMQSVGLFVNPDDEFIRTVIKETKIDLVQLHGSEPPERVAELRALLDRPIMKAVAIADKHDLTLAKQYEAVADYLLLDSKPPPNANRPGGNAKSFDWSILATAFDQGFKLSIPWFLAGGLTPDNVALAIKTTGATAVDASSGIEIAKTEMAKGEKDSELIKKFIKNIKKSKS